EGGEALRHASRRGRARQAHAGRQRHGSHGVRHRPRQEDQADAVLPDDHGAQFRRDPAGSGFHAAHGEAPGGDARELEAGPGRDHRRLGERRGGEEALPEGLEGAQTVSADHGTTQIAGCNNRLPLGGHPAANLLSKEQRMNKPSKLLIGLAIAAAGALGAGSAFAWHHGPRVVLGFNVGPYWGPYWGAPYY